MKRLIPFIFISAIILSACSNKPVKEYGLSTVFLDGDVVSGQSGYIELYSSNKGKLSFNNNISDFNYSEEQSTIYVKDLVGQIEIDDETIDVAFESLGLVLNFSANETHDLSDISESLSNQNIKGRLYYSNCEGVFSEYENTSIGVTGTMSDSAIYLYNEVYSDIIPMISFNMKDGNCTGGYVMAFPVDEYDVISNISIENSDDVNNTEFLNPEEYIWNKYSVSSEDTVVENPISVLTLAGSVRNSEGGFTYKVVLINNE